MIDPAIGGVVASEVTASIDLDGDGAIDPVSETGLYAFDGVAPGSYVLRQVAGEAWTQTLPDTAAYSLTLISGDTLTGLDFGNAAAGTITGGKFEDTDHDGILDAGEFGLNGWTIELVDAATGEVLATRVTADIDLDGDGAIDPALEAGRYVFDELLPRDYELREVAQERWVQTLPAAGAYAIDLAYGRQVSGKVFGGYPLPSEIHGQKYYDINTNGLHDPDEPGLNGWTLELVDSATGAVVATQVTAEIDLDADGQIDPITEAGRYAFIGLTPGDYVVREVLPADWVLSTPVNPGPGAEGPEFLVNTHTENWQVEPAIAVADDGHFIVVWYSYDQYGEGTDIYGQMYHPDGTPDGGEFLVNTEVNGYQSNPSVAMGPAGRRRLLHPDRRFRPEVPRRRHTRRGRVPGQYVHRL